MTWLAELERRVSCGVPMQMRGRDTYFSRFLIYSFETRNAGISRNRLASLLPAALLFVAAPIAIAQPGQDLPAPPGRVVVPWPAGGSIDSAARVATQRLQSAFGGAFVVDNRAGAAGTIG